MTVQTDYVSISANCGEKDEIEEALVEVRNYLENQFLGREVSISIQSLLSPGDIMGVGHE